MIILFKIILCSGLLLGLYYIFLAKEKTFTFNRFYLLFGLGFSYSIPFVTIEKEAPEGDKPTFVFETITQQPASEIMAPAKETFNYENLFIIVYAIVAVFFLLKFIYSIIKIKKLKGEKIIYNNKKIILLKKEMAPFSFMNTIYFAKSYLKSSRIDENMFLHEQIHVDQKHSLDIFFVEILKILMWFNPFIYVYKKAIATNHEFLADEKVIGRNNDIKSYQQLILSEILKQQNLDLIHPFNFDNTKKRFIMMTTKNSKFAPVKKYLSIPIFLGLIFVFAEKVYANNPTEMTSKGTERFQTSTSDQKNNSEAYEEFIKITEKYKDIIDNKDFERFKTEVPRAEQVKLVELFDKIEIKNRLNLPIWIHYDEINKQIPTQKQLNQFLDTKFNVTLDGNTVENSILKNYKTTDFYSVYVLKIHPKNPDYGKFDYSVTLYTPQYAKKFNSQKNIAVSFKQTDNSEYEEYLKTVKTESKKIITETKKVMDTIRPKEGKNTKIDQEVVQTTKEVTATKDENILVPQYPGGINELRTKIAKSFDGSRLESNKTKEIRRTDLSYTVTEDGNVTDIKASGSNEQFNNETVISFRKANENITWKPAEKDGKPIRYRMRIPLMMSFQ
ncbi:hypothetical protein ASG22_11365 [Chryseobacterium sp. Leaf405]|uniref:M56 family metallopeptidase n=1 Tax=Chryseobacterium sp. Leaf405 TaxID=1736367 RepID=UPI0006F1E024|nr:M56 family metallopeptidase [Chryseobacterium sp. Leaf405]KQT24586.1 hypothetical protein ASG22_11365 [Chryseobacterium sp. Leaf405]